MYPSIHGILILFDRELSRLRVFERIYAIDRSIWIDRCANKIKMLPVVMHGAGTYSK